MKINQLKEFIGINVSYQTTWGDWHTGVLIEIDDKFAVFEKNGVKTNIKVFNIQRVEIKNRKDVM